MTPDRGAGRAAVLRPSATRALRLAWQATFLALFLWLMAALARGDPRAFRFSFLHELDPLPAAGLAIAAGTFPRALLLGAALLAATAVLGRFFCGWVCPLGTLQQLAGWLLVSRRRRDALDLNRWRPWQGWKYVVLAVLLAAAAVGSLQVGLLDPISMLSRGLASALWPALPRGRAVPGGVVAGLALLAVVLASRWLPRFFCRALCPAGALLGVFGRFALFRIDRDAARCDDCRLCTFACQGADEPLASHRTGECMVCHACVDACPEDALRWRFLPALRPAPAPARPGDARPGAAGPDFSRRHVVGGLVAGLALAPVVRAAGGGRDAADPRLIRPPGALPERAFLDRCTKCLLCGEACPTGAIQPALARAGVEGFWSPVVVPRRGGCELACTRCGDACPTGAIAKLSPARKTGYDGRPPVSIGTAFVDRGRCLPWANQIPCIVCEEMCPTDPKAIRLVAAEETRPDGARVRLQKPQVEPRLCVGCGICENRCPVGEEAGVRVSSVGETRDPLNRMLLGG